MEDEDQTTRAKENWSTRRKGRHGFKENKPKGQKRGRDLKNNKTKAIEKKFKKRLISKSQKSKSAGKPGKQGKSFKKRK